MRKRLIFLSWSLLLFALFCSCKKEEKNIKSSQFVEIVTQSATGRIGNSVINWLDNQKAMSKPKLKDHLELLTTSLELSKAKIEEFNDADDFIIIPLNKGYNKTKKIDERNKLNLIVFAAKSGEIKGANIVEFIPEPGKDLDELPANTFKKVIYKKFPGVNGAFKVSRVSDHLYKEIIYKKDKLFSSGIVQKGTTGTGSARMEPIEDVLIGIY